MKSAFGYYRVSTDEQAKEGKSIEAQTRICRRWAKDNDFVILEEFADEGKSASTLNRPALQDMLSKCKEGEVNAIIVLDTDRLARNTLDHLTIKALIEKKNIQLISISQPLIDNSPEGNLIDTIVASVNQFQSQITGRKTSKVMEEKAKLGWYPAPVPLGYKNIVNPNPTCSLDKNIVALDEETAPYIKQAFELYSLGDQSLSSIAKFLNGKGVRSPLGNKIHRSHVGQFLRNEFYIGKFKWKKISHKGNHPKLITPTLFEKVNQVIDMHNQYVVRKRINQFLLRGFIKCETCGSRYYGEKHNKPDGREYSFYLCSNCTPRVYIDSEQLELKVEQAFRDIQLSKEYVEKILATANKILLESRTTQQGEQNRTKKERYKLEKAIREAEDSRFITHTLTEEQFLRLYNRYNDRLAEIDIQLQGVSKDHSESIKVLKQILRLAENVGNAYAEADPNIKRGYLNLFFESFTVENGGNIVNFELSKAIKPLIATDSVLIGDKWLRGLDVIRTEVEKFVQVG